jgi:hypothetical protein
MRTYRDIANLSQNLFEEYLIDKITVDVKDVEPNSIEGATYYAQKLIEIARRVNELTCVLVAVRNIKRCTNRVGTKSDHQDLIDKESSLNDCIKALDMIYKALNRNIVMREVNNRELYITGAA